MFKKFSYILIILSSCSTVRTHKVELKGIVYDVETEAPVKNAEVKAKLTEPWVALETKTNEKGEFVFSTDGNLVLSDDFLDESDKKIIQRKVKVNFSHPDFVEDEYEESLDAVPIEMQVVNVGTFYLSPKEKEPLVNIIRESEEASLPSSEVK